jgi:hypothetical protein
MNIFGNHIFNSLYKDAQNNNRLDEFVEIFNVYENKNALAKLWSNIDNYISKYQFEGYEPIGDNFQVKVKGDIVELFCLAWMQEYGGHKKIGFRDIEPTERDAEGTDFIGLNVEGLNSILQTKGYNKNTILESGDLETFFRSAPKYRVGYSDNENIPSYFLFIPYGKVEAKWAREMHCRIIDSKLINSISDKGFWKSLYLNVKKEFKDLAPQD